MSELWKDIKYLQETLRQQFRLVVALKLSLIPILMYAIDYLGGYFEIFVWPTWISHIVTLTFLGLGLLFVITRKARTLEEPKLLLSLEHGDNPSDLVVGVQNGSHIRIEHVEVVLTKITCDRTGPHFVNLPCTFLNEEDRGAGVSLNPLKMKYAMIGRTTRHGEQGVFSVITEDYSKTYEFNEECLIELEASAHNSSVAPHIFSIENRVNSDGSKVFVLGKIE